MALGYAQSGRGATRLLMGLRFGRKKQPAHSQNKVQAAFLCFSLVETQLSYRNFIEATLSDDLHPQYIHNQLKYIRMPAAAGVIEVKRFVSDGVLGQQLN